MTERICLLFPNEELRFYCVGGSGTLANIVSGVRNFEKTEVACYPTGLSNDFLKSFGKSADRFRSMEALVNGRAEPLDMIDINGCKSLVFVSFGLGNTCFNDVLIFKLFSAIRQYLNYGISVLWDLLRSKCDSYNINIDGRDLSGDYALAVCFNGMCMGGGVMPLKDPRPNDGVLNLVLSGRMPRRRQLGMLRAYASSRLEKHRDVIRMINGRRIEVSRRDGQETVFNCDGECLRTESAVIGLAPEKLRFVVPDGAEILPPTSLDRVE